MRGGIVAGVIAVTLAIALPLTLGGGSGRPGAPEFLEEQRYSEYVVAEAYFYESGKDDETGATFSGWYDYYESSDSGNDWVGEYWVYQDLEMTLQTEVATTTVHIDYFYQQVYEDKTDTPYIYDVTYISGMSVHRVKVLMGNTTIDIVIEEALYYIYVDSQNVTTSRSYDRTLIDGADSTETWIIESATSQE